MQPSCAPRVCSLDWYQCAYKIRCETTDWAALTSVRKMELPLHCVSGLCVVRSLICFLAAEGIPTPAIHTCLKNIYGDSVMPLHTVCLWAQKFKEKRENVHDTVLGFQGRPVCTLCRRGKKGRMNLAMYVDILDTLKKRSSGNIQDYCDPESFYSTTTLCCTRHEWLRRKLRTSCGKFLCIRRIHPVSHLRTTTSSRVWRNFWVRNGSRMTRSWRRLSMDERCGHAVLHRWYQ